MLRSSFLVFGLVFCGCGAVRFDVEQDLPEQNVQGSALPDLLPASLLTNGAKFTIDLKSEVQRRGTGPATKARLKALTLAITPHGSPRGNFNFLDEVHLFVEGPGLAKVEIATLAPVPDGQTTVSFTVVEGIDLLPYINAGSTITATATGSRPSTDTSFDGHVVVEVQI